MHKIKGIRINDYPEHKHISDGKPIISFLKPKYIYIPLTEGGSDCEVKVNEGQKVCMGHVVANRLGRFSSPIHSSVSGEVVSCNKKMWHSSGKMVNCIQIKNDFKETVCQGQFKIYDDISKEEILKIAREKGIVGLGGSAFPTYVKLGVKNDLDLVIINGAECEPFITGDYRLMIEKTNTLIKGIHYIMKAVGAKKTIIAIKKNKLEAIEKVREAIAEDESISIKLLKDEYPAGYEKYLVQHIRKKNYKILPSEVGVIVNNVATSIALCEAIEEGKPLIEKVVTFTGFGLQNPQNVRVKIGTDAKDVIDFLGGYTDLENKKTMLITGGPMTANTVSSDNLAINRSLGCVLVLEQREKEKTLACLGCGKCAKYCPLDLNPTLIKRVHGRKEFDFLKKLKPQKCVACGLCSYICPSRIDLTQSVLKAKATLRKRG